MATSLITLHINELQNGKFLVVLPIRKLHFDEPFVVGQYHFHPPGSCSLDQLRAVPNARSSPNTTYEGQKLREVQTSATGITVAHFNETPLISFCVELNWDRFLGTTHKDDLRLIRDLAQQAERAMDVIKFAFCRFDLPETLPSFVGSWEDINGFSAALLYTLADNESYLIAGAAQRAYVATTGLGLELDPAQAMMAAQLVIPAETDGDVGAIAKHALLLFSDVLSAPTPTTKFLRATTLIEFLATPDAYRGFKDAKYDVICHCAHSKNEYHQLANRFRELSSCKDESGKEQGYRTLLVHRGQQLERVAGEESLPALFRELQNYCAAPIDDMIERRQMSWEQLVQYRDELKQKLGVKPADGSGPAT